MKILEIITDLGSGGAERFVVDLSNELANSNDVTLMTLLDDNVNPEHRNFNRYALDSNVAYYNLGLPNGLKMSSQLKVLKAIKAINPDIINNPGIYNLLTTKYNEAEENGIKVNITFLLDLNNLNMKIYEFARILGILLDNAIDAASECDNKILNISFRNDAKNNRNIILIENTYTEKNVNLDDIFKKGVTGKFNHTGLGLWEVKQILNKNNNINLYTSKDEQYFSQQLEIYY